MGKGVLTQELFRNIINLRKDGKTYKEISKILGCNQSVIGRVLCRRVDYSILPPR